MVEQFTIDAGRVRVVFEDGVPSELGTALRPILERWGWILPTICDELRIYYTYKGDDDGAEYLAACESMSEYRVAEIHVYPRWFTQSADLRERVIVHELCHVITAPLAEFADFVAERCSADPLVQQLVQEQNRRACESVTSDLEKILLRTAQPQPTTGRTKARKTK